jgi:PAS domain S-box-containing protein
MAERERLAAIITQMPAAVAFAERTGRVVLENPRVKELLGHSLKDVTSFASYGQLHGRDESGRPLDPDQYPLLRALRGELIAAQEYRYLRTDGREVWLRAAAAPVRDARGEISGAIVLFRNIDAEKDKLEPRAVSVGTPASRKVVAER